MRRLSTVFLIASLPLAMARADDPAPAGDLAKLQGTWTAKVGPDQDIAIALEIKNQKATYRITREGQERAFSGELRIDEKASPKTIDWVKFAGSGGDEVPDNLSIYKLDGDSFILCSGGPRNDRPTEFKAGEGGPPHLFTLARKKDDEAKGDLAKLQGTWKAMIGPNKDRPVTLEIKDKAIIAKFTNDEGKLLDLKGEVAINESASPRTIDFVKFKNDGDDVDDSLGVYKIEGETLTLCVGGPGDPRPSEFKSGGDEAPRLWTFTRPK